MNFESVENSGRGFYTAHLVGADPTTTSARITHHTLWGLKILVLRMMATNDTKSIERVDRMFADQMKRERTALAEHERQRISSIPR